VYKAFYLPFYVQALITPSPSLLKNNTLFWWYLTTFILIWLIVLLGGATRLTHSGLSIVEWKPITGIIPPLNHSDWLTEFGKYQKTPEFIKINHGITLETFKFIYGIEYAHRLLGRLIGIFFLIPLIFLWKSLDSTVRKRSLLILFLGGIQGFLGWYMVKSGLSKEPTVSHYRLTLHLSMAFILMGLLAKWITPLKTSIVIYTKKMNLVYLSIIFVSLTIIYGGLVAGLKAGLVYNTFPLMDGKIIPEGFLHYTPFWKNFLDNHATVQWVHRLLGILTLLHVFLFFLKQINFYTKIWFGLVLIQVTIGIVTLLYHVPLVMGTLHQGMGALVFSWGIVVLTIHKKEKNVKVITQT
jgi:cytochrome c oxidase assembly protein subunit 15